MAIAKAWKTFATAALCAVLALAPLRPCAAMASSDDGMASSPVAESADPALQGGAEGLSAAGAPEATAVPEPDKTAVAAEAEGASSDAEGGVGGLVALGVASDASEGGSAQADGADGAVESAGTGEAAQGQASAQDGSTAQSPDAAPGSDGAPNPDGASGPDAAQRDDAQSGAQSDDAPLDPANLPDGTYTVSVQLLNASDVSQKSMAASAIDGTDELSVQGGAYTLGLTLGAVQMGSITGYVSQVDAFASFAVADSALRVEGEATPVWTSKAQGDAGPAALPVPDSAKADGYIGVQLHSAEMPVSPQKAVVRIDWATLQKTSDSATAFDSDASGAQTGDSGSATPEGQETAPAEDEAPAAQPAGAFQVGHVYSVPIYFTKAGTSEQSMAGQYFGATAVVRPRSDGTFDVRFSTNRPDYVESISYNGSALPVTSEAGASREFSLVIPHFESDTTVRLGFVIAPMRELGADSVDADLHLYFSRAADLGGDTGQVAVSTGGGASLPATGDALAPFAVVAAMFAVASALVLALACRKLAVG